MSCEPVCGRCIRHVFGADEIEFTCAACGSTKRKVEPPKCDCGLCLACAYWRGQHFCGKLHVRTGYRCKYPQGHQPADVHCADTSIAGRFWWSDAPVPLDESVRRAVRRAQGEGAEGEAEALAQCGQIEPGLSNVEIGLRMREAIREHLAQDDNTCFPLQLASIDGLKLAGVKGPGKLWFVVEFMNEPKR